jgi:GT2 family glycosyltransferase
LDSNPIEDTVLCRRNESVLEEPRVSIIILNWNGWADTTECLKSLNGIDYNNYHIIIVDNNSEDNSLQRIKKYAEEVLSSPGLPVKILEYSEAEAESGGGREGEIERYPSNKRLILVRNSENYGFAGGNNVGMKYALKVLDPKYVLLLNSDTVVCPSFLRDLVEFSEGDRKIGSAQPLLLKPGGDIIDSLGHEALLTGVRDKAIGTRYVEGSLKDAVEIFGPCAAAALYRSNVLKDAGLFDESFFIISEDVDLSWRARLKGYSSFLVPWSVVYHKRGLSGPWFPGKKTPIRVNYSNFKNWCLIALRYYPFYAVYLIPRLFMRNFFRCTYYAWKLGMIQETLRQFLGSLRIRMKLRGNPHLKEIQSKWLLT